MTSGEENSKEIMVAAEDYVNWRGESQVARDATMR